MTQYKEIVKVNSNVSVDVIGPAAIITLRREDKLNALSVEVVHALIEILEQLDERDGVRGIVITGSGRAFSSGVDLKEVLATETVPGHMRSMKGLRHLTDTIEMLSKPVVAAIHGICYTGGLELAMACDRRIGGEDATFSMSSARIGSVAGFGGTQRLPRLVGVSAATDIIMTGRVFDAPEAYRLGLLDELVQEGDHVAAAREWIEVVANNAPIGVALAKLALRVGPEMSLGDSLQFEGLLSALAGTTEDRREGIAAIFEKRKPAFKGR